MSKQLDQMIADAATKNLGFAQALKTLADLELDSRNGRAIERRFRMSRLHAQHSIDSFHFKHHKSRMESKNRIVRLLDLEFIHKGTSVVLIGNPGGAKRSWPNLSAGAPAKPISACCSPPPWTC